jgi:hypothetical protein
VSFTHSRVGSKDANHDAIAELYRQLGCSVVDVHHVPGFCDLIVGCVGRDDKVEIKTDEGELRPKQAVFHSTWRGKKPEMVRNEDDVIAHVQRMRRHQP